MNNFMVYDQKQITNSFWKDEILIFIDKSDLNNFDEYKGGDPYNVNENLYGPFQKRRFNLITKLIKKYSETHDKILDIGCGEGQLTNYIKKELDSKNVFGCDYSFSAIKEAKKNNPQIYFCVADALKLPYRKSTFDVILCANLFEHVESPAILVKNCYNILNNNGLLIISTPSRYRFGNLIRVITGRNIKFMSNHHITEYTVGQVKEITKKYNFKYLYHTSEIIIPQEIKYNFVFVLLFIPKMIFNIFLRIVNSHHNLESTVFYVFKK